MTTLSLMRRVRLRTVVRSLTRDQPNRQLQYAMGALMALISFVSIFGFASLAFTLWTSEGLGAGYSIVAGVYEVGVFAVLLLGIATAVHTMYLSTDLPLLLSMPIRERTIFEYKFLEILTGDALAFLVLGAPVLLAWGLAADVGWIFYPLLIPVTLLVLAIPTGISILLVMPLMRVLPAGRAKEIVAALSGLLGVGMWAVSQVFTRSLTDTGGPGGAAIVPQTPLAQIPPGSWAADLLLGAASGDWERLLRGLLPLVVSSALIYAGCLAVSRWAYTTGWARVAESGRRARGVEWIGKLLGWLPRDVRAVVTKDLASFPRDLRQIAGAGSVAVVGIVFALLNHDLPGMNELPEVARLGPYVTVCSFAAMATVQAAFQSIGGEGRAYWLFAVSPISTGRLLVGKWIAAWVVGLVTVLLGSAAVSTVNFYLPGLLVGILFGGVLAGIIGLYAVGISAAFPRFDWENPKQSVTTGGGFLVGFAFMWIFISAPLAIGLGFLLRSALPTWGAVTLAGVVWFLAVTIPGCVFAALGYRRLKVMDWEL